MITADAQRRTFRRSTEFMFLAGGIVMVTELLDGRAPWISPTSLSALSCGMGLWAESQVVKSPGAWWISAGFGAIAVVLAVSRAMG